MTTRFSGESAWGAIVNDNSLDIVQEEQFAQFCEETGTNTDNLSSLGTMFRIWEETSNRGYITIHLCLDCGIPVGGGPTRCTPCANKA